MHKLTFLFLAPFMGLMAGLFLAKQSTLPPSTPTPVIINNYPPSSPSSPSSPSTSPTRIMASPSVHPYFPWRHWANRFLDYYYPRSLVGNLIVGLYDPRIRSLSASYLCEAWQQVKASTATISPEAATKLETELEPMASRTLQKVQASVNSALPGEFGDFGGDLLTRH